MKRHIELAKCLHDIGGVGAVEINQHNKAHDELREFIEQTSCKSAWCQAFVNTVLDLCGLYKKVYGSDYHCLDCTGAVKLATKNNKKVDFPCAGDLVYFANDVKISHVAFIYEVDYVNNKFRIIEGNYNNRMNSRLIDMDDKSIYCYVMVD